MEEEASRKRKCERCNRRINIANYELHLTKCKPKEPKPSRKEQEQRLKAIKEARRLQIEARAAQNENRAVNHLEERFPCHLCGFAQNFVDLDTHPRLCPNRETSCIYCAQKFPVSIMTNHQEVCIRRPRPMPSLPPQPPASNEAASSNRSQSVRNDRQLPLIPQAPRVVPHVPLRSPPVQRSEPQQASRSESVINTQNRSQSVAPQAQNRSESVDNHSRNSAIRAEYPPRPRIINHSENQNPSRILFQRALLYGRPVFGFEEQSFLDHQIEPPIRSITEAAARQRISDEVNRLRQAYLAQQLAARHIVKKEEGLSRELIKLIPEKKYIMVRGAEQEMCAICCTDFCKGDKVKDLSCKHNYHSKCISEWLRINRSCPLCKADLSVNIKYPQSRSEHSQKKGKKLKPVGANSAELVEKSEEGLSGEEND